MRTFYQLGIIEMSGGITQQRCHCLPIFWGFLKVSGAAEVQSAAERQESTVCFCSSDKTTARVRDKNVWMQNWCCDFGEYKVLTRSDLFTPLLQDAHVLLPLLLGLLPIGGITCRCKAFWTPRLSVRCLFLKKKLKTVYNSIIQKIT